MLNTKTTSYLEQIRWGDKPQCPYCSSTNSSAIKNEGRYRCNTCFTSYSVTVGTLFHKTRVDIEKWVCAINLIYNSEKSVSVRQLAKEIDVNKNTASSMISRIRKAMVEEQEFLDSLRKIEIN
jgi:transposase-like protein